MLAVDFKNAFNTIDRGVIFQQVAELCPALLPWIKVLYQSHAHLVHGTFWLSSKTGADRLDRLVFAIQKGVARQLTARMS